jgi:hypothetical protein
VHVLLSGLGLVRRDGIGGWWFSPVTGRWQASPDEPAERRSGRDTATTAEAVALAVRETSMSGEKQGGGR